MKRGAAFPLPLFIPVYRPGFQQSILGAWSGGPKIEACMVNAFFLYKDRQKKAMFKSGLTLAEYVGFNGLLCTDSGAFQGFERTLLLSNKTIIAFQDMIGADIVAPLDLVTPPGDKRSVAEKKLDSTQKRVRDGLKIVQRSILAGIQQGGRFMELRQRSVRELVEMGVQYLGIGSLVPFFNRNHDLTFVGDVIRDARHAAGDKLPMHVYGAGDPLELPFMAQLGADIFDSSSYGHFANDGYYMTPYGALKEPGPVIAGEFSCPCPICAAADVNEIFGDVEKLTAHNLWTICDTVLRIRATLSGGGLESMLEDILERHTAWFPNSALGSSWRAIHE